MQRRTKIGEEQATLVVNEAAASTWNRANAPLGLQAPADPWPFQVPVYNLSAEPGEPALFGFVVAGKEPIFLDTEVSWEGDFHESFTIHLPAEPAGDPGCRR